MDYYFSSILEKIRRDVTVFDVMRRLGHWEGPDATKQVRCTFHGPDTKPSARVYKDVGIMYCFACAEPRYDAIRYVQAALEIKFVEAVYQIKDWFKLSVSDDYSLSQDIENILGASARTEVDFKELEDSLIRLRGSVPFDRYLSLTNYLFQIEQSWKEGSDRDLILREVGAFRNRLGELCKGTPM